MLRTSVPESRIVSTAAESGRVKVLVVLVLGPEGAYAGVRRSKSSSVPSVEQDATRSVRIVLDTRRRGGLGSS
jgi:hypothetical protein